MNEGWRRNWKVLPPLLLLAAWGCGDWMHYDQGAPIPPQRFRDIHEVTMGDLPPATQAAGPSTAPTTRAATRPARLGASTRPLEKVTLTLTDVRRMALANNLDIKVVLYDPTIAKQAISEEEAAFEALFTTNIDYTRLDTPTSSRLNSSQVESVGITPGVSLPLRTGGTLKFDSPWNWFYSNNAFNTMNPVFNTPVEASISQPLLRGFGPEYAEHGIKIAALQYQQSEARTKLAVIRALADADRVYWRLYAARQLLLVREQQHDLAAAQLERARHQAAAGAAPEVDVVRAESGVADSLQAVITAENDLRQRERELKRVLNEPGLEIDTPTVLIPGSEPHPVPYSLDADRLATQAVAQRMEMLELELQIAQEASNVRYARNQMLPAVALAYTYRVNALGGTISDSLAMLDDKNFEDHMAGVGIEVPIGNEAARSRLRRALAARMQALATKEQRSLQIRQEVYDAVDNLNVDWQQILAARQRVVLAARVAEAEIRQFNLGLRTSTDVVDAQARLADAKSAEVAALTLYQIAEIDIAYATGTLLGASKVTWEPVRVSAKDR